MRVESLASRLEFNERRARALESVVVYKPSDDDRDEPAAPQHAPRPRSGASSHPQPAAAPSPRPIPLAPAATDDAGVASTTAGLRRFRRPPAAALKAPGQRSRRRRRRRGRRRGGAPASGLMGPSRPTSTAEPAGRPAGARRRAAVAAGDGRPILVDGLGSRDRPVNPSGAAGRLAAEPASGTRRINRPSAFEAHGPESAPTEPERPRDRFWRV